MTTEYPRGLTFEEVAFIKAARLRGFARDYIMGFLMHPGRTLSPACINDVVQKDKAKDVPPASQEELDQFVAQRLAQQQTIVDAEKRGPLSTFLVHQELGWALGPSGSLFGDEGRRLEFKRELPSSLPTLAKCAKAAAAFANTDGGYLVFGIDDETKKLVGVDPGAWRTFDWDKFSTQVARVFQPSINWQQRLIGYHGSDLGVVYVHPTDMPPVMAAVDWQDIHAGAIYYRYPKSSERIRYGDLLQLLARRDRLVRRREGRGS